MTRRTDGKRDGTVAGSAAKDGTRDLVDRIVDQWRRERPDLDTSPMAVIARISRLSRILERRIAEVLEEHGLTEPQFGVLAALRRAGPPYTLSPTALYSSLLISSGAMTNRLERLTSAGYVRRIPDPHDRRSTLVQLTPKGLRTIEDAVAAHATNEQRLLAPLSRAERRDLAALLRTLLSGYEDESQLRAGIDSLEVDGERSATVRPSRRRPARAAP